MTSVCEIDLSMLFDELLRDCQRQKQSNSWSTKNKIFISTLVSSECERQLRFIFEDAPKDDPLPVWAGLESEVGTLVHDKIQQALMNRQGLDQIEKKISITIDGVTINMKIDGVFKNRNLFEIKTLGPKDYNIQQPREKDRLQLNFYLGVEEVKEGILTYLKRDNGKQIKSFKIEYDRESYKKVLYKICKIIENKDIKVSKRSCKFCQFTNVCRERGYRTW